MPVPEHSHRLYWILQFVGWTAYGLLGFTINLAFDPGVTPAKIAALAFSGSGLLLLLTHLLRNFAKRRDWSRLSFGPLILRLFAGSLIVSIASQVALSLLMIWPIDVISAERPYSFRILAIYIFQTQIILLLWCFIYFAFHAIRNYKSEEIERWRLQAVITNAELIALKAQINPHFMFNCLNNIRALVLEDSEKAREAITRLSDLLRYSLQYANAESVTVEQEIAIVNDYLALEAIHMEQRLRCQLDIAAETLDLIIPPMVIQLLAENAIKHGLAKRPEGGLIRIKTWLAENELHIEVVNTGQLEPASPSTTGVGLPNLRERIALLHGPKAQLALQQSSPTQVAATLTLPVPSYSATETTAATGQPSATRP